MWNITVHQVPDVEGIHPLVEVNLGTILHGIALNCIALHIVLHRIRYCSALHYIALHYI